MTHEAVPPHSRPGEQNRMLWRGPGETLGLPVFQPRHIGEDANSHPSLLADFAEHHQACVAVVRYVVRLAQGTDEFEWHFGSHPSAKGLFQMLDAPSTRPGQTGTVDGLVYEVLPLEVSDELRGMLLMGWEQHEASADARETAPHLALFLLQTHRLQEAEATRSIWLNSVRHQAILSESLEWLTELETHVTDTQNRHKLYTGLLSRSRILCDAESAALALYRDNGSCYQWIPQGISPDALDALMADKADRSTKSPGTETQILRNLLEFPICTPKGLRARIYLANRRNGEFSQQDEAYVAQLSTQVFKTLEKLELMEDLQLSNQFLAMERRDQELLISELKDTQQQLLHSEKLASIGQLAAGVAHEINNPVSFVSSNLFYLQNSFEEIAAAMDSYQNQALAAGEKPLLNMKDWPELRDELQDILTESRDGMDRVRQIVLDLKNFSRVGETGWQLTDLRQCIESTLNIVRNEIKYKAEVIKEYGDIPLIQCASSQINQVIMNLIVNAAQAIPEKGTITIRTGTGSNNDADKVFFSVRDTGHGIKPEHLRKIFDPFFTTKPVGKGTGLGLSLSFGIVQKHHGRIEVASEPGAGTTFTVWLPKHQDESEADQ